MWWRLKRPEYLRQKGAGNRAAMKKITRSGDTAGLIAYVKGEPVAWCSVGPRESFPVLDRSRVLKRLDEKPVWSIVCMFVARPFRKRGITVELLKAAVAFVRERGGRIVEGYPIDPSKPDVPDLFAATGLMSAFRKAGFKECVRRSDTRPIMRYEIRVRGRDQASGARGREPGVG
jgi:GNAT superfamily N-acetyltransferase